MEGLAIQQWTKLSRIVNVWDLYIFILRVQRGVLTERETYPYHSRNETQGGPNYHFSRDLHEQLYSTCI